MVEDLRSSKICVDGNRVTVVIGFDINEKNIRRGFDWAMKQKVEVAI